MCTNLRWIHNKYTDSDILVSCGHCKACKQEKANRRATRLKNELNDKQVALFITLTYDRFSCPYVKHEDILNQILPLPVYRDCTVRRDCVTGLYKRRYKPNIIAYEDLIPYENFNTRFLPYLNKTHGNKVGVCIFSDVQDFNKRLRQNLKRIYKYEGKYKVYNTFEYGETTFRPHIHQLMFVPSQDVEIFKSAIVASWPFARRDRTRDNIQIARDAASYVASYVNSGSKLPLFIAQVFPPKHSFSQGLGCGRDSFQLDKILENVQRRSMSYNISTTRNGVPCSVNLPIPKYVINRFFPLFKGYSRLTSDEVYDCLSSVDSISKIYESLKRIDDARMRHLYHFEYKPKKREEMIFYTLEDIFKIGTSLHNSYLRYKRITGKSTIDYANDFFSVWSCYKNTIIKYFMLDDEELKFKYDNKLDDLVTPRRLQRTRDLEDLYDKKCKTKYINNEVFSSIYDDV